MGSLSISAPEIARSNADALSEAVDALASARDPAAFLAALETTHRVWLRLNTMAKLRGWTVPERRHADFALATSGRGGRGVTDAEVEALIRVGREVAQALGGQAAPWRCARRPAASPRRRTPS